MANITAPTVNSEEDEVTRYKQRLRGLSLQDLADEASFLPGGTREDELLEAEIARRQAMFDELVAAGADVLWELADVLWAAGDDESRAMAQLEKAIQEARRS